MNTEFFLPPERDRVLISRNPRSGRRSSRMAVAELADRLHERGLRTRVVTDLDEMTSKAERWQRNGELRCVIGSGGDGTACAMLNLLPPGIPFTLLAGGTENLLARYFRLGRDPERVAATVAKGRVVRFDAGLANGRLFLLMASCGFDADVVERFHIARGKHITHLSYAKPILDSIRSYQYPSLRIYTEDCTAVPASGKLRQPVTAAWMWAFNLPCYAGGLPFVPEADANDGLIDACAFRQGSIWNGLRYLTALAVRQHRRLDDFSQWRCGKIRIESDERVPYQIDGDPGGVLPLELSTVRDRVSLVVPSHQPAVGRWGWPLRGPVYRESQPR